MGDPLIERAQEAVEFLGSDSKLGQLIETLSSMLQEEWRASASPGAETGGDAAAELRWALEHFHGIGWHGYPDSPCDCPKCQWARRVTALLAPGAETVGPEKPRVVARPDLETCAHGLRRSDCEWCVYSGTQPAPGPASTPEPEKGGRS